MTSPRTFTLTFRQLNRNVVIREDETVLDCARRNGIRIVSPCGGRGACQSCIVRVTSGEFTLNSAGNGPIKGKWHRSCDMKLLTDCTIELNQRSLAPAVRAEPNNAKPSSRLKLDTCIKINDVRLSPATLEDPDSDDERLATALHMPMIGVDPITARELPTLLRDNDWSSRLVMRNDELIAAYPLGTPVFGLAVDLGTTNIAGFLINLTTGRHLSSLGIENPQCAWGADVISRINYSAKAPENAKELQETVVTGINDLARNLCKSAGTSTDSITDVVICGNTAMHHILLGLPVRQLGCAPFVAAIGGAMTFKARDLALQTAPGAYVHLPPSIGGFVGGDHVTALLGTDSIWNKGQTSLLMDIGTNTEISLIYKGRISSTSCPSGPALEGGHISCGMRAATGAIENVSIQNGRILIKTIGDAPPVGLCGSGVVDVVAALLRGGLLDQRGRLIAGHPDIENDAEGRRAVLAPGIFFEQNDIRAVQLAKAAIQTAVSLLLDEASLIVDDIQHFIIAGAFGAYLSVESGIAIGLFPDIPRTRFHQVGNSAGLGVRLMLASDKARAHASKLAKSCEYKELNNHRNFQKIFLASLNFPRQDNTRMESQTTSSASKSMANI